MTIKRVFFRFYVRSLEFLTMIQPPRLILNLPDVVSEEGSMDLVTIAFNKPELVKFQSRFIDKFIQDPFTRIIADNSTDSKSRKELSEYCRINNIGYIGLPHNFLNRVGGSYSHAAAINYVYRHFTLKRKPFSFGLIDHDIFPTKPVSISQTLMRQPVYGPLRKRGEYWYLSAIMSFFRFDFVKNRKVDFMPVNPGMEYLDTGGGNWYDIYSKLDFSSTVFPDESVEPFREGNNRHNDFLEYFDNKIWVHTINGSCWKKIQDNDGKQLLVEEILNRFLN